MISKRLQEIIGAELGMLDLELSESTTTDEVPGWDSLAHVSVVAAVEHAFGIRFKTLEVLRLANVGQLQALVERKLEHRVP